MNRVFLALPCAATWLLACPVPTPTATVPATVVQGVRGCGDSDLAARPDSKCLTYRAVGGVSMGGGAAARLSMTHPELWDVAGIMGTPLSDSESLLRMLETNHLGGFCSLEKLQQAMAEGKDLNDPNAVGLACGVHDSWPLVGNEQATRDQAVLEDSNCYAFRSDFQHWYRGPEAGRGGTFNRTSLLEVVQDFAAAYGNPFGTNGSSDYLGVGVPSSWIAEPGDDAARAALCASPVVVQGVFNKEFNPDGSLPAVTFCDGAETGDLGTTAGQVPFEIGVAIDVNRNGRKDYHEPVVLNGRERWRDVGGDGVADADEPGYDPISNRDPSGDNWDSLQNPDGHERDWRRTDDEAYEDNGLDGVANTDDYGEDNGRHDVSPLAQRWIDRSAATLAAQVSDAQMGRLNIWMDSGIRDFLNSTWISNGLYSALRKRIANTQTFVDFESLPREVGLDAAFQHYNADYRASAIGQFAYLRYGDPSFCPSSDSNFGSGNHVGTGDVVPRILTLFSFLSARMPAQGRDRSFGGELTDLSPNGALGDFAFLDDYDSAVLSRNQKFGVLLPPDYFLDGAQDTHYPVLYFMHGQGQRAEDMVGVGLVLWPLMQSSLRPDRQAAGLTDLQRAIIIWVDGECLGSDCHAGNFYLDFEGKARDNLRFETAFYELMLHVESKYRVLEPAFVPRNEAP